MKKTFATFLLLCVSVCAQGSPFADGNVSSCPPALPATAQAASFADGDARTGEKLFERYKCNGCHIDKVGGDGSAIFTRPDRTVASPEDLVRQMTLCSGIIGMTLAVDEQQHLGAYLNQRYYKFGQPE